MSSSKCARCEQTVYPIEGLRCLDKIWHKGCFKCQECNMTLSLKNHKGFEKKPYCNAHCPQAKATTVADTPEIRRLAENTRIQSQAKYHEDFEKSKGKGFTTIADDPEVLRIKNTSKIISNVAYHGELERKKQMEEKRGLSGPDEIALINNNNNNGKHQNGVHHISISHNQDYGDFSTQPVGNNQAQGHYQSQNQQQQQQQQRHLKQQQLLKQQQHMHYAQSHNGQAIVNHQTQQLDGHPMQQQLAAKHMQQQQQLQQQQLIMLQQQQHQLMMQQQQQQLQRQSFDPNLPLNRQQQPNNKSHPQQMIKHQMIPNQHQQHPLKYMPMNDVVGHQRSPTHLMGGPHLMNSSQLSGMPNGQRVVASNASLVASPPHMIHGYDHHQTGHMNGPMPKQPPRQMIHPSQVQSMNNSQMRPHSQQMLPIQLQPQQMPRRVFRAIYDYVANDVDEVSFFENDILIDCVNVDGNWLIGKVARSGQTGMLPANYVAEFTS